MKLSGTACAGSVRGWLNANDQSAQHYLEIEPQAPIVYVPKIELNAPRHQLNRASFAAEAINLSPAGQTWFHVMPKRVIADYCFIFRVQRQGMRPRPDKRHIASHYIDQLRQFINVRAAQ